jgi:hypothetical protein
MIIEEQKEPQIQKQTPENPLDMMTLKYLMNKDQYLKHVNGEKERTMSKRDRKFYRKRIFDLTKRLLNNEVPERMYPDVNGAFEDFSKICIEYFKLMDMADIIQEDYEIQQPLTNSKTSLTDEEMKAVEEANQLLIRTISMREPNSLEKLVKRTVFKKAKKQVILPQQKNINLTDPTLKNKGILKKKNIDNNYEQQKTAEK